MLFFFPCGAVTVPVPGICCATFVMYIFSNMLGSFTLVTGLSLSLQLLQIFIYCCFICSVFFGSKNFLSLYFFLPHEIFEVYFSSKCGRFCELSFCYWFLTCTVVSKWGLYATDSLKFENCFVASWLVFQLLLEWLRRLCTHRLLGQGRHINIYIYTNTCICLRSSLRIVAFKSFLTVIFWFFCQLLKISIIKISIK